MVVQLHDHQSRTIQGAVPLVVLDVWEHAYYLQYETAKAKYIEAVWNLWNWAAIGERYDTISRSSNAVARL
jgi:Fe-Mn family superoxide dismutase